MFSHISLYFLYLSMFPTYFSSQTGAVLQVVPRVWPWACCRTTSMARHHGWDLLFKRHGFWNFGINNVNMFFCFPYLFCLDLLKIGNIGKPIKSRAGFQPRFLQVDAGRGRLRLPVPWLGEWLGHFWRCWLDPNFFMVNFLITFFFRWNSLCGFIPYVDAGVRPSPRPTPSWTPSIRRASPTSDTRAPSSACPAPKSFLGFRGGKKHRGYFCDCRVLILNWSIHWDLYVQCIYIYMYSIYIYTVCI